MNRSRILPLALGLLAVAPLAGCRRGERPPDFEPLPSGPIAAAPTDLHPGGPVTVRAPSQDLHPGPAPTSGPPPKSAASNTNGRAASSLTPGTRKTAGHASGSPGDVVAEGALRPGVMVMSKRPKPGQGKSLAGVDPPILHVGENRTFTFRPPAPDKTALGGKPLPPAPVELHPGPMVGADAPQTPPHPGVAEETTGVVKTGTLGRPAMPIGVGVKATGGKPR